MKADLTASLTTPARCSTRSLAVSLLAVAVAVLLPAAAASADPCGMVPPVYTGEGPAITRVGAQKTYVFYRNGVETFVIRPGFSGKVEEFGMLIPFPSVPAMRKVDDATFSHIAAAIDPPEVVIDLAPRWEDEMSDGAGGAPTADAERGLGAQGGGVRVLKEEAIGMYEVVVLEAGSAAALKKWMDGHGYRYPAGMDAACNEYVAAGWCFVAVKTRVSKKSSVDPRPGMEHVQPGLDGGTFDGNVQAMGFRFRVPQLVVPMRLSSFNAGELHNIVYLLTDKPMTIRNTPNGHVRRQVSGADLYRNITQLLPLRVLNGTVEQINAEWKKQIDASRDPRQYVQFARELFAFDLLASVTGNLSHPHEEREKELLNIGERLDLRGPEIDALNHAELADLRAKAGETALELLKEMTLTVWDGDFDRDMLARENLTFVSYRMPAEKNTPAAYNAIVAGELAEWQARFEDWWSDTRLSPAGRINEGTLTRQPLAAQADDGHGHDSGEGNNKEQKDGHSGHPDGGGDMPPPAAGAGGSMPVSHPMPPADQGPPLSAIPPITLVWLAMGAAALALVGALLAFGMRPWVQRLMAELTAKR